MDKFVKALKPSSNTPVQQKPQNGIKKRNDKSDCSPTKLTSLRPRNNSPATLRSPSREKSRSATPHSQPSRSTTPPLIELDLNLECSNTIQTPPECPNSSLNISSASDVIVLNENGPLSSGSPSDRSTLNIPSSDGQPCDTAVSGETPSKHVNIADASDDVEILSDNSEEPPSKRTRTDLRHTPLSAGAPPRSSALSSAKREALKLQREEERRKKQEEKEKQKREKEEEKERLRRQKEEEKEKQRLEKERIKLEKEREKEAQRLAKEAEKQRLKDEAEKKKQELEQQKQLEKEEKEREREREKEQKRLEKLREKEEKQKKLEEEKRQKELEKQRAEQERKEKLLKEQPRISNFIKVSATPAEKTKQADVQESGYSLPWLRAFQPKEGMHVAPPQRRQLSERDKGEFDSVVLSDHAFEKDKTYLSLLKSDGYKKGCCSGTLADVQQDVICEDDSSDGRTKLRAKCLQFHDNNRPAYYGTWRKSSKKILPRNPFAQDTDHLDYEVDSDDEWEPEPEDAEECRSDEEDVEGDDDKGEPDEDEDGFFVPHGYLSEGEGEDEDGEEEDGETRRARLAAKAEAWKVEKLNRKWTRLQKIIIGPDELDNEQTVPKREDLRDKFKHCQGIFLNTEPMLSTYSLYPPLDHETAEAKDVASGNNLPKPEAKNSPSASDAQSVAMAK